MATITFQQINNLNMGRKRLLHSISNVVIGKDGKFRTFKSTEIGKEESHISSSDKGKKKEKSSNIRQRFKRFAEVISPVVTDKINNVIPSHNRNNIQVNPVSSDAKQIKKLNNIDTFNEKPSNSFKLSNMNIGRPSINNHISGSNESLSRTSRINETQNLGSINLNLSISNKEQGDNHTPSRVSKINNSALSSAVPSVDNISNFKNALPIKEKNTSNNNVSKPVYNTSDRDQVEELSNRFKSVSDSSSKFLSTKIAKNQKILVKEVEDVGYALVTGYYHGRPIKLGSGLGGGLGEPGAGSLLDGLLDLLSLWPFKRKPKVKPKTKPKPKPKPKESRTKKFFRNIKEKFTKFKDTVKEKTSNILKKVKESKPVQYLKDKATKVRDFVKDKATRAKEVIKEKAANARDFVREKAVKVKEVLKEKATRAKEVLKEKTSNLIDKAKNSNVAKTIQEKAAKTKEAVKDFGKNLEEKASNVIDKAKKSRFVQRLLHPFTPSEPKLTSTDTAKSKPESEKPSNVTQETPKEKAPTESKPESEKPSNVAKDEEIKKPTSTSEKPKLEPEKSSNVTQEVPKEAASPAKPEEPKPEPEKPSNVVKEEIPKEKAPTEPKLEPEKPSNVTQEVPKEAASPAKPKVEKASNVMEETSEKPSTLAPEEPKPAPSNVKKHWWSRAMDWSKEKANSALEWGKDKASSAWEGTKNVVKKGAEYAAEGVKKGIEYGKRGLEYVGDKAVQAANYIGEKVKDVGSFLNKTWNDIKGAVTSTISKAFGAIKDVVTKLTGKALKLWKFVKNLFSSSGTIKKVMEYGAKFLKAAGKGVAVAGVVLSAIDIGRAIATGDPVEIGGAIGNFLGSSAGAVIGGAAGSFLLPGVATLAGSVAGGIIGGIGGEILGRKIGGMIASGKDEKDMNDDVSDSEINNSVNSPLARTSDASNVTPDGTPSDSTNTSSVNPSISSVPTVGGPTNFTPMPSIMAGENGYNGGGTTPGAGTMPSNFNGGTPYNGPMPNIDDVGALSSKFESGGSSACVAWDRTGGTSYGMYQFSSKAGSMRDFMNFLASKTNDPVAQNIAQRLEAVHADRDTGSKQGAAPDEWKRIAAEGNLTRYENEFSRQRLFDTLDGKGVNANARIPPELQSRIKASKVLQQVFFSTMTQHGPTGGSSIFKKVYRQGMSDAELISAVYEERGRHFGSSTAAVQRSVLNRFQEERSMALAELSGGGAMPMMANNSYGGTPSMMNYGGGGGGMAMGNGAYGGGNYGSPNAGIPWVNMGPAYAPAGVSDALSGAIESEANWAISNHIGYDYGAKDIRSGNIDCSGFVSMVLDDMGRNLKDSSGNDLFGPQAKQLFHSLRGGGTYAIEQKFSNLGIEVNPYQAGPGTVLLMTRGSANQRGDRHTAIVMREQNPQSKFFNQLVVAESTSGSRASRDNREGSDRGVMKTPLQLYVSKMTSGKNPWHMRAFNVAQLANQNAIFGGQQPATQPPVQDTMVAQAQTPPATNAGPVADTTPTQQPAQALNPQVATTPNTPTQVAQAGNKGRGGAISVSLPNQQAKMPVPSPTVISTQANQKPAFVPKMQINDPSTNIYIRDCDNTTMA